MKNNATKNRKSRYNPNRPCYLSTDGKYYCYEVWDEESKQIITQQLEVGKDGLTTEWTLILDELDHDADLTDRYGNTKRRYCCHECYIRARFGVKEIADD